MSEHHDDIIYPHAIPFVLVHLACLGVIWTGARTIDVAVCLALYLIKMFAITAGKHRYFSHRSFKTSRVVQFLLAFVAQTSAQRGVVWWAAKHREHHKHSDTVADVHSPRQSGFWFSHVGWVYAAKRGSADRSLVKDLMRYPELVWLDKHHYVPPTVLAVLLFATLGWSGLVVGFFVGTVLTYHGTFAINSLAHLYGNQRYITGDDSRNNWLLALITLGEGWHNNHHYYQASTRQGFRWWEIDVTYYCLKGLSWAGVVWDLRSPPAAVLRGETPLSAPVIRKVARELASTFTIEAISERIRRRWPAVLSLEGLPARARSTREQIAAYLAEMQVPELPTLEELKQRAREMYAHSPSLDDIAARAREILIVDVSQALSEKLRAVHPALPA